MAKTHIRKNETWMGISWPQGLLAHSIMAVFTSSTPVQNGFAETTLSYAFYCNPAGMYGHTPTDAAVWPVYSLVGLGSSLGRSNGEHRTIGNWAVAPLTNVVALFFAAKFVM